MKSTIALSAQERAHLKRTQGQALGTDKPKDIGKPEKRTKEGLALDKMRGLEFVAPQAPLKYVSYPTQPEVTHLEKAPKALSAPPSFGEDGKDPKTGV